MLMKTTARVGLSIEVTLVIAACSSSGKSTTDAPQQLSDARNGVADLAADAGAPSRTLRSTLLPHSPEPFPPPAVSVHMYRALVIACMVAACVSSAPPSPGSGDKTAKEWPSGGPPGREPDLGQALFFARVQGGNGQLELKLEDFVAQVRTGAQATRTHLWITVANPGESQVEAVMRLPVPAGAAVTRAVLHVGAEVQAQSCYRDLLLATLVVKASYEICSFIYRTSRLKASRNSTARSTIDRRRAGSVSMSKSVKSVNQARMCRCGFT